MKSLAFFIFLICGHFSFAQSILKGTIVDASDGGALVGANIFLKSDFSKGAISDEQGEFELKMPTVWERDTLFVSYIGYQGVRWAVDRTKRESLKIELHPVANNFDVVEVKANRMIASEFVSEKLSQLDIYLNPNSKADALLAVQSLPASTSVDETANISLRGSSPAETGIFLNNVPIYDAVRLDQANGIGQFSIFNTAILDNIQVFPSNPPMEFGAASAGVIALYTKDKSMEKVSSAVLTMVGGGLFFSRPIGDKTSVTLYGNLSTHHVLKEANKTSLENITDFSAIDVGVNVTHNWNERSTLKIFNYSLKENYRYRFQAPTFEGLYHQSKKRNMTVANYSYQWPNARIEFNQGINISRSRFFAGNFDSTIDNLDFYSALNYHYFKNKWSLKGGVALDGHRFGIEGEFPQYPYAFGDGFPSAAFDTTQVILIPEFFLYGKRQLSPSLTLGLGVRYHPQTAKLPKYWSRQVNLNYRYNQHSFTLSAGYYYKYLLPNAQVESGLLSNSQQIAFDYRFKKMPWDIQVAIYHKKGNLGNLESDIRGGELFLGWQSKRIKASASIASIHSYRDNGEQTFPSRYDLSYFFRGIFKYDIPDWVEVSMIYQQRQGSYYLPVTGQLFQQFTQTFQPIYAEVDQGERLPDYHLLDVSISRIIPLSFGSLIVFLSVNNVLDIKNVRGFNYNFDYTQRTEAHYNRRVWFVGGVVSW